MTLKEEFVQGENVALEFKEARPKDSLKHLNTGMALRTVERMLAELKK